MTKKFLLFGKLRPIEVDTTLQNREVVMSIRKELKKLADCYSFDLLVNEEHEIVVMYHYDYVDTMLETEDCNIELTRLVTGEGVDDFVLPFPIADGSDREYDFEKFATLWKKNNQELGGNIGVKLVNAQATYTGMVVIFKYDTV